MTNEWGPPLTGDEMKALKGRIDPSVWIRNGLGHTAQYGRAYKGRVFDLPSDFHLPANHPYYKVREYNQKHGTNLVLHDGSANKPEDWDGGAYLCRDGDLSPMRGFGWKWGLGSYGADADWDRIAYTPKPKESEMSEDFEAQVVQDKAAFEAKPEAVKKMLRTEADDAKGVSPAKQFPKDEAIEYVLRTFGYTSSVEQVKEDPWLRPIVFSHARLIQQYEPERLKPAVDVAAEAWCKAEFPRWGYQLYKGGKDTSEYHAFKAGAAWRLNNPTA